MKQESFFLNLNWFYHFDRVHSYEDLLWFKGKAFSAENEVRFYFSKSLDIIQEDNDVSDNLFFDIDISVMIDEIILSPYINNNLKTDLKEKIKERYPMIKIIDSNIEI